MDGLEQYITLKQVAEEQGFSKGHVTNLVKLGTLKSVRLPNNTVLVDRADYEAKKHNLRIRKRTPSTMVMIHLYAEQRMADAINALVEERDTSMSEIVRRAVEEYLIKHEEEEKKNG